MVTVRNIPSAFLLTTMKIREPLRAECMKFDTDTDQKRICGAFVKTPITRVFWDVTPRC